jgi:hypothetical protein
MRNIFSSLEVVGALMKRFAIYSMKKASTRLKYRNEKRLYESSESTIRTGLISLTQCNTMQPQCEYGLRLWRVVGVECNSIKSFLSTRKESLNDEKATIRCGIGWRSFQSETKQGRSLYGLEVEFHSKGILSQPLEAETNLNPSWVVIGGRCLPRSFQCLGSWYTRTRNARGVWYLCLVSVSVVEARARL